MQLKKWTLLSKTDVSPSKWFPIELRTYELPNGKIVDDFTVTTLADVAMIVAVTPDEKIVLVRQYKPGFDEIIIEFPAGRMELSHKNIEETAKHELEEETGIRVTNVELMGVFAGFVTKATEKNYCYFAENVQFNALQQFDANEEIEVLTLTYAELEELIENNEINGAITVAAWDLAKRKYAHRFESWK